jgi:hypothetical protein
LDVGKTPSGFVFIGVRILRVMRSRQGSDYSPNQGMNLILREK